MVEVVVKDLIKELAQMMASGDSWQHVLHGGHGGDGG